MMTLADLFQSDQSSVMDTTNDSSNNNNKSNNKSNNNNNSNNKSSQFAQQDDFATVSTPNLLRLIHSDNDAATKVQFPTLLHSLIKDTDDSIVSWNQQGTVFCIHNREKFMEIVPHYFKLKLFRSFTRQLNMWGYQSAGRGRAAYQHPKFHRDYINLCRGMRRDKIRKSCFKKASPSEKKSLNSTAASRVSDPFQSAPSPTCNSSMSTSMNVLNILNTQSLPVPRCPQIARHCVNNNNSAKQITASSPTSSNQALACFLSDNFVQGSTISGFDPRSSRQNNTNSNPMFLSGAVSANDDSSNFPSSPSAPDASDLPQQTSATQSDPDYTLSDEDRVLTVLFKHLETEPLLL